MELCKLLHYGIFNSSRNEHSFFSKSKSQLLVLIVDNKSLTIEMQVQ